jgi:hypothetical protein
MSKSLPWKAIVKARRRAHQTRTPPPGGSIVMRHRDAQALIDHMAHRRGRRWWVERAAIMPTGARNPTSFAPPRPSPPSAGGCHWLCLFTMAPVVGRSRLGLFVPPVLLPWADCGPIGFVWHRRLWGRFAAGAPGTPAGVATAARSLVPSGGSLRPWSARRGWARSANDGGNTPKKGSNAYAYAR